MNRRGVKIPTETMVGLAVFIILILGVFTPLFAAGYNFFFGSKISELSVNNFERLTNKVDEMINSEDGNSSFVISLQKDIIIVGFNYDCDKPNNDGDCPLADCGSGQKNVVKKNVYFPKPKLCGIQESCLCYFKESDDDLKKPVKCVGYNKNVIFKAKKDTLGFSCADSYKNSTDLKFIITPSSYSQFSTQEYMITKKEVNDVIAVSFSQ